MRLPIDEGHSCTRLDRLLVGEISTITGTTILSGIAKRLVTGPIHLSFTGFQGDRQADLKHHGGPEKAVHHYPFEHYSKWREIIGDIALLKLPGAFGENMSMQNFDEDHVAIGDVFSLGTAVLEVSQSRQPCWKLNARFDVRDFAWRVQVTGRCGWYYRVLREGLVASGDWLERIYRHSPEWTISRVVRTLYTDPYNYSELSKMAALSRLSVNLKRYAECRLETRDIEDWSRRLYGHFE
ncbi:MAG: MOSC domain-containing protein [Alphaproteobacteria bacterium]|nr:MOSC domain-containing protein [Alphaproteobacteria bacterium]